MLSITIYRHTQQGRGTPNIHAIDSLQWLVHFVVADMGILSSFLQVDLKMNSFYRSISQAVKLWVTENWAKIQAECLMISLDA